VTDYYKQLHDKDVLLKRLLDKLPDEKLSADERELKARLRTLPQVVILNLIYQRKNYERVASDFEFSARSMKEHRQAGYQDTNLTLKHKKWLTLSEGVVMDDIHRANG
jgi:NTE family protein